MYAQVHRAQDRRFAPWKNGGGETAEIVCFPPDAGFDSFGWRISTARVGADGPFSRFDGVARSLTVIEGGPLRLDLAGSSTVLDTRAPPFAFSGETPCHGALLGGPVLDLNVMTRAPFACVVQRGAGALQPTGQVVARFLFAVEDDPAAGLARHDLAQLDKGTDWPRHGGQTIRIAIFRP